MLPFRQRINFEYDLRKHEKTHILKGEQPFSCCICNEKFAAKEEMKTHELIHTEMVNENGNNELEKDSTLIFEPSREKNFSCVSCEESFDKFNELRRHKRNHKEKQNKSTNQVLIASK